MNARPAHSIAEQAAKISRPAFVVDELRLQHNLSLIKNLKQQAGIKIIYATKACPLHPIFTLMQDAFDGSTASGLYEAKLGHECFGKEVHVYCPAYTAEEVTSLLALNIRLHIYFNSIEQLQRYAPQIRQQQAGHHIGLRLNPGLSISRYTEYDPCRTGSYLGVPQPLWPQIPWAEIDAVHLHALCENMGAESAALVNRAAANLAPWLGGLKSINFGGGHFITHPNYHAESLIAAIKDLRATFPHLNICLEPGAAAVYDTGYLVGSVLDIVENEGVKSAILDISANCLVPDVHKIKTRLPVLGAKDDGQHLYVLASRSCMARDIWGEYAFAAPLEIGQKIIFADALQYSLCEANWFNGQPRPDYALLRKNGDVEIFHQLNYADFKQHYGSYSLSASL